MKPKYFIYVFVSAVMIALSRLPLHLGWMVFLGFVPLLKFFELPDLKPKHLLWSSFIYAAVYVPVVLYWITLVTPGGFGGVILLFTLYYFIAFYVLYIIWQYLPRWRYLGFLCVFLSFEYLQNFGELRFPWLNLGYSLADYSYLLQFADIGGVLGLSVLILTINLLVYQSPKLRWQAGIGIVLILSLWGAYGWWCTHHLELQQQDPKIYVMQPAIEQEDKWEIAYLDSIFTKYRQMTIQAAQDSAKLVIWPEAAVPFYLRYQPGYRAEMNYLTERLQLDIFTGFPDYVPLPKGHVPPEYYYNAAALFAQGRGMSELYYKMILVPIGERIPWLGLFPVLWKLQLGQANWEYGTEIRSFSSGGYSFSPSICYEIAFPILHHKMAFPQDPGSGNYSKNDYLVNLTNDAWFGTSYGPWLHGTMTRFRAIENRIQIYRSANTGISMIVDPLGRVLARTELYQTANITAPLYTTRRIPVIRKIYLYPAVFPLVSLALLIGAFRIKRKKRISNEVAQ